MGRRVGFTLFELMIVVTVIALIAAFAIPTLHTSFKSGKEAATISALRTLHAADTQYSLRYGAYSNSLLALQNGGYVDSLLGAGTKSGYTLNYNATRYTWSCVASPEIAGVTGDRYFFVDHTGVIRMSHTSPVGSSDTPID